MANVSNVVHLDISSTNVEEKISTSKVRVTKINTGTKVKLIDQNIPIINYLGKEITN